MCWAQLYCQLSGESFSFPIIITHVQRPVPLKKMEFQSILQTIVEFSPQICPQMGTAINLQELARLELVTTNRRKGLILSSSPYSPQSPCGFVSSQHQLLGHRELLEGSTEISLYKLPHIHSSEDSTHQESILGVFLNLLNVSGGNGLIYRFRKISIKQEDNFCK